MFMARRIKLRRERLIVTSRKPHARMHLIEVLLCKLSVLQRGSAILAKNRQALRQQRFSVRILAESRQCRAFG